MADSKGTEMFLVQLLLPIRDNAGAPYPPETLNQISRALAARFGGVTAYSRAPAKGQWIDEGSVARDDVIAVEVMVGDIDREWWRSFRETLEMQLSQKEIVVRSHAIERL